MTLRFLVRVSVSEFLTKNLRVTYPALILTKEEEEEEEQEEEEGSYPSAMDASNQVHIINRAIVTCFLKLSLKLSSIRKSPIGSQRKKMTTKNDLGSFASV